MTPTPPDPTRDWLIGQGLEGDGLGPLLQGSAERLVADGVPLWRAYLALPTVDPLIRVTNHVWRRDRGVTAEPIGHERFQPRIDESPIFAMLEQDLTRGRWRLGPADPPTGFTVVEDLRAEGATDYLVHLVGFGGRAATALRGVALTFAADVPGGFSDAALARLDAVAPTLALAAYRIALLDVAVGVLDAYVGLDAGRRVLAGEIRRGHGEALTAALLFADLHGFTGTVEAAATSQERGVAFIARLGDHLAAMVEPVEARGGEVLKFLGDGLLAAFPYAPEAGPGEACAAALAAARDALARNVPLAADGQLGLDVALHLGTVFYGNIGAGQRLDFTVIGPAVNELSRMEALCGRLGQPLLFSAAFAECCGAPVRSLGAHVLRGLETPRELFAPA